MQQQIRTLGLYQPFASLMLHGKIETRWVRNGKKPPFPLGQYLIYSTQKKYTIGELMMVAGLKQYDRIQQILREEPTKNLTRTAICTGWLSNVRPMTEEDEDKTFVAFDPEPDRTLWCLEFDRIIRIIPFPFLDGHQGIGFLSEENKTKII
jgi:hypothetical protein